MTTDPNPTQWRDISEAPKDGTVLLWLPNLKRRVIGWWNGIHNQWNDGWGRVNPTHFMPLPPPPTADPAPDLNHCSECGKELKESDKFPNDPKPLCGEHRAIHCE